MQITKRSEQLKFHIKNKEYFMQLATCLDLVRQSANRFGWNEKYDQKIKKLMNDLCYLDQEYNVTKKPRKKDAKQTNNIYEVSKINIGRLS